MKQLIQTIIIITALIIQPLAVAKPKSQVVYPNHEAEVQLAFQQWLTALEHDNPEVVVDLYRNDATLLATLEGEPLTTQEERVKYFSGLLAKPNFHAVADSISIRVLDKDTATTSGLYTFRFEQNGEITELPARFLFVYEKEGSDWMIVEHHSSQMPQSS
jgi:uncharacterized protein (TIGR02246 family)